MKYMSDTWIHKMERESRNAWEQDCFNDMARYAANGWIIYYLNFMFEATYGTDERIASVMKSDLKKWYYRWATEFHRRPDSPNGMVSVPKAWLFPDKPVPKRDKSSLRDVVLNNGLHFNGLVAVPYNSRATDEFLSNARGHLKGCAPPHINRIHPKPVTHRLHNMVNYATKSVRRETVSADDILVFPAARS